MAYASSVGQQKFSILIRMAARSGQVACLVNTMMNVTNVKIVLVEQPMIGDKESVCLTHLSWLVMVVSITEMHFWNANNVDLHRLLICEKMAVISEQVVYKGNTMMHATDVQIVQEDKPTVSHKDSVLL